MYIDLLMFYSVKFVCVLTTYDGLVVRIVHSSYTV